MAMFEDRNRRIPKPGQEIDLCREKGPSGAKEFLAKFAPIVLGAAILGGIAAVGVRMEAVGFNASPT